MSLRWILRLIIVLPWAGLPWAGLQAQVGNADRVDELPVGHAVERHLPPDVDLLQWAKDADRLALDAGDRLEAYEVVVAEPETVKLHDVVPPVYFESGVAKVPESTVAELRSVLDGMRDRANVRLNLVGHADNQPLSPALAERYGDNDGLSRERAGEVAEFFQRALALPSDAVSYEWAGASKPVASNATEAGRALNRRVDVEVWYDELTDAVTEAEQVVSEDIRTIKVCRVETVCKLRYVEGHAKRARVQNLVAPLYYQAADLTVTPDFVGRIAQTLENLRDRENVVVKLVGHTDDAPLSERETRIYGDRLSLSRARAHRVALAVQEQLDLPAVAVMSEGYGDDRLAASNATARGRALNRRIEVEFWYDDSLQELPDEPQLCPADATAELVTRVYHPEWGDLPTIALAEGQPVLGSAALAKLERGLSDVSDRANARLRFIGYTRNESLDRRTALIYGDDVGLSAARARRTMDTVAAELGLESGQTEHVGRGYIHSKDVINAGFVQGEESYVEVQVLYDELAVLDDYEGVEIDPLTRELTPENPFALNMMRITVDGEPIDDPQRSSADVQRCTDVAMEERDIRFSFDTLVAQPRLDVAVSRHTLEIHSVDPETATVSPVRFRMYANYQAFIGRSEVRIFDAQASIQSEPLAVLPVGEEGYAEWEPDALQFHGPVEELVYVLRAYGDSDDYFDETLPKPLRVAHAGRAPQDPQPDEPEQAIDGSMPGVALAAGYGENSLAFQNIPLGTGTVTVKGRGLDPVQDVWVAGTRVPVDPSGAFVSEVLLPDGGHTVEVAMIDEEGAGELYLRDISLERNDWFYTGMADITWSENRYSENAELFVGENASQDFDSSVDGRIALYASGKFGADWGLTTSLDTTEDELGNLFGNLLDKDPNALFRRMDPDYHYPTFGDDSTVTELAPTQGGLYLKVDKDDSYGLWGNYKVGYMNNELAQVDRGLYGVQGHYETTRTTSFGEKRLVADLFGAEPGTIPSRQDFLGTGGSFYYLRHQDILMGSERVRIEVRDKASGIVTGVVNLSPSVDYDVDYLQGTVLLSEPLSATVNDNLLVRTGGNSGDEAYLVVRYEYTPGFDEIDALAAGGQAHVWLNDRIKLGVMANENNNDDAQFDSSLQAADLTVRLSAHTWLKVQTGRSEGVTTQSLISDDGGYGFQSLDGALIAAEADTADAFRGDLSIGLETLSERLDGRLMLYGQTLESGYTAPGLEALTDTEAYGGSLTLGLSRSLSLRGKSDVLSRADSLSTSIHELNLNYQLNPRWNLSGGIRHDDREDDSVIVLPSQELGQRTDAVMQVGYDGRGQWSVYGFAQDSLSASSTRAENGRYGLGGSYLVSDRIQMEMEVSDGDSGPGGRVGTSYRQSERTSYYVNYALENERTDNGLRSGGGSEGNLVGGMKTRLSDTTSLFVEERYQHGQYLSGLTHATGVQLVPSERWNFAISSDIGTLKDRQTGAETDRVAGGLNVSFGTEALQLSVGVEYRDDTSEQLDALSTERKTWLYRNSLRWQMNPASRLLGKLNYATSDSSEGAFFDGEYTEAVFGYGFRPVRHDRLNAMAKYTYFYNVPTAGQVTQSNAFSEYVQKSHIASVDVTYDLTSHLSVGAKYAYRLGEISLDREALSFFDNSASLYVVRADWRFRGQWEVMVEARALEMEDLGETRSGSLVALSRYFGEHFKVGAGYNFTDFSDDLTDLDYDHRGLFLNLTGAF